MGERVECPLCWSDVEREGLPAHLRAEIGYAPWSCGICRIKFADLHDARNHFAKEFSRHPESPPDILERIEPEQERRVNRLIDGLAKTTPPIPAIELALATTSQASAAIEESLSSDEDSKSRLVDMSPLDSSGPVTSFSPPSGGRVSPSGRVTQRVIRKRRFKPPEGPFSRYKAWCSECSEAFSAFHWRSHVARRHLRRPVFQCSLCGHEDFNWATTADIKRHLRAKHGTDPNAPDAFTDLRPSLKDDLEALGQQLIQHK